MNSTKKSSLNVTQILFHYAVMTFIVNYKVKEYYRGFSSQKNIYEFYHEIVVEQGYLKLSPFNVLL